MSQQIRKVTLDRNQIVTFMDRMLFDPKITSKDLKGVVINELTYGKFEIVIPLDNYNPNKRKSKKGNHNEQN